ncbi:MAG TPA: glycosyltransferase family 2 protein [Gaiellaceae bacterium]|nr:glycosyltransferase family 2 protein [Gaiellaceae bacterium]
MILAIVFWISLGAIVWTHAGYPLAVGALAVLRRRRIAKAEITPSVAIVVAAHNEEAVIDRVVESLLAQDYPRDLLEVVVASDGSTDGMEARVEALAERDARVRLVRCGRGGKVAAQNAAVRTVETEVVAFADAGAVWAPDALAKLVRSLADPKVGYVAGRVVLGEPDGTNREGAYWRYELWLRKAESALGSITGGNGAIYALRREDYVEVDPRFGHDLTFPYVTVQRGKRAVYEPEARAWDRPARDLEDEYGRKVRMFEHCWLILLRGRMLRGIGPLYAFELFAHRVLRYASGLVHLVLLGTSIALVGEGLVYELVLAAQLTLLVLAVAGRLRLPVPGAGIAYYYVLVTWATVAALFRYVRFGVPPVWEKVEGTR